MDLAEILAAIGGPVGSISRPDGGSDVTPLTQLGLDRPAAEGFPENVTFQQGAGSPGNFLTPLQQGEATDGQVLTGGPNANAVPDGPQKTYSGVLFPSPQPGAGQFNAQGLDAATAKEILAPHTPNVLSRPRKPPQGVSQSTKGWK
jgi:hypothetical protein